MTTKYGALQMDDAKQNIAWKPAEHIPVLYLPITLFGIDTFVNTGAMDSRREQANYRKANWHKNWGDYMAEFEYGIAAPEFMLPFVKQYMQSGWRVFEIDWRYDQHGVSSREIEGWDVYTFASPDLLCDAKEVFRNYTKGRYTIGDDI
jgi:hypothetical protein